ncbi:MAG: D-lyxose/D-mannose family sugar isomerase, partial [Lentisphaerae bacterium]|nr:D-lyxose/D-mannose family sugar isomerase [Lentisphaerota bacterium]
MKRSEVNAIIQKSVDFLKDQNFSLPPFAFWSAREWSIHRKETQEIRKCMLGWDITDFGLGHFKKIGLVLFTIRNGHMTDPQF